MTRMYRQFHHEFINKRILAAGYELKEEIHGRKHDDKSYFTDMMAELDAKAAEQTSELAKREEQVSQSEKQAAEKVQSAEQAVQAARREQEEAREQAQRSYQEKQELEQEIEMKLGQVKELEKKIESREKVSKIQDEVHDIYHQSENNNALILKTYGHSTKKIDKKKINLVHVSEEELQQLQHKAKVTDGVMNKAKAMELMEETILKAADHDERIQRLKKENAEKEHELKKAREEVQKAKLATDYARTAKAFILDYLLFGVFEFNLIFLIYAS